MLASVRHMCGSCVRMYVGVYGCMCIHMYVCMYVCVYVCHIAYVMPYLML